MFKRLAGLFRKKEKRSILGQQHLISGGHNLKSVAGVAVSEQSSLNYPAVYAAVRIISETIGALPLNLYKRSDKDKSVARAHPLYKLLHDEPNSEHTALIFREMLQGHLCLWGNAYAWIKRDGMKPVALIPLLPDRTEPIRIKGELFYRTRLANNTTINLPAMDVLHIPGLSFNGLNGYSPIRLHRESIGLGMAAQEYGSGFFGRGATLSGVLETDNKLDSDAQESLKNSWTSVYSGLNNSHKTAVLEQGLKYKNIGVPPEDAQFLETRKFQVTDIARIFRIPPHMLADLEKATFSNIGEQAQEFVKYTMLPWFIRWEQELNRKLLRESEKSTYFIKFNVKGLLRGDLKTQTAYYMAGRQWGWLSPNDIRSLEDMNHIEGGDIYHEPLNMQQIGIKTDSEEKNSKLALGSLLDNAEERVISAEVKFLTKALANPNKAIPIMERFMETYPALLSRTIKPVLEAFAQSSGIEVDIPEAIERIKAIRIKKLQSMLDNKSTDGDSLRNSSNIWQEIEGKIK